MSIEPEDLLEEALRSDAPSPTAEKRLRRRLLGAGLAVGGSATTGVAVASGGASGAGALKVVGLSWGFKVGLAAAVAIPGVGLLWEHAEGPHGGPALSAAAARASASSTHRAPAAHAPAAAPPPPSNVAVETGKERAASSAGGVEPVPRAPRPVGTPAPHVENPSRAAFSDAEASSESDAAAASTLSEETRLLDRAFAELAAGNVSAASTLVTEHESRYPRGLLMHERLRAKAKISELSRGE